jgi:hypothetical protein
MANVARVRAIWSGSGVIGGGVSTFYVDEAATGFVADLRAFFDAIKASIPSGILIDVPANGDLLDIATGALSGTWNDIGALQVVATGAGTYVSGAGARIRWATSGIRNGRRVRGSTFVCPMIASYFDADGTPNTAALTLLGNAANVLRAALPAELLVYSRPGAAGPGQSSVVIGSDVPNHASWLRSRRT